MDELLLRCRCGSLRGRLAAPGRAARALCYCRDCRAFARFLGAETTVLDGQGGTDIVATCPRFVQFDAGAESLRCLSLSPRGLLRWYAGCCRTPVGNTPRDPKLSYVGLLRGVLADAPQDVERRIGPARARVHTGSAIGARPSAPLATLVAGLKIVRNVWGARLSGRYRDNPFFLPGADTPRVAPQVLTRAERQALDDGA